MTSRLYLFDDARARQWEPFALTRPGAELVLGALRIWERAARAWGVQYGGHLAAAHLAGFREDGGPRALDATDVGTRGHRILVCSRAVVQNPPHSLPEVPTDLYIDGGRHGMSPPPRPPLPAPATSRIPLPPPGGKRDWSWAGSCWSRSGSW